LVSGFAVAAWVLHTGGCTSATGAPPLPPPPPLLPPPRSSTKPPITARTTTAAAAASAPRLRYQGRRGPPPRTGSPYAPWPAWPAWPGSVRPGRVGRGGMRAAWVAGPASESGRDEGPEYGWP